jgi:hypothetical protein
MYEAPCVMLRFNRFNKWQERLIFIANKFTYNIAMYCGRKLMPISYLLNDRNENKVEE